MFSSGYIQRFSSLSPVQFVLSDIFCLGFCNGCTSVGCSWVSCFMHCRVHHIKKFSRHLIWLLFVSVIMWRQYELKFWYNSKDKLICAQILVYSRSFLFWHINRRFNTLLVFGHNFLCTCSWSFHLGNIRVHHLFTICVYDSLFCKAVCLFIRNGLHFFLKYLSMLCVKYYLRQKGGLYRNVKQQIGKQQLGHFKVEKLNSWNTLLWCHVIWRLRNTLQ